MLPILIAVAGASTPFVILAFRYRARRAPFSRRPITDEDRQRLRGLARVSIVSFIAFWITSIALIVVTEWSVPTDAARRAAYWAIVVMAAAMVSYHLSIRCPSCGYRLGYQRSLWVPPQCERCGAGLS